MQLVLTDPGHSGPDYYFFPWQKLDILFRKVDKCCLTLLLELAIFSIFAMFWTKKIILIFDLSLKKSFVGHANYDGG